MRVFDAVKSSEWILMVKKNYQLEINFACSAEDTEQLKLAVVIVAGRENHRRINLQQEQLLVSILICVPSCVTRREYDVN